MLLAAAALAASAPLPVDPVVGALARCLHAPEPVSIHADATVTTPPGLAIGEARVAPIAGAAHAFAIEGIRGASCGVALYGPVRGATRRAIRTAIAAVPGWRPFDPAPAQSVLPARRRGWGLPPNPTMYGAILYERRPTPAAPTIEVTRYAVLVP